MPPREKLLRELLLELLNNPDDRFTGALPVDDFMLLDDLLERLPNKLDVRLVVPLATCLGPVELLPYFLLKLLCKFLLLEL